MRKPPQTKNKPAKPPIPENRIETLRKSAGLTQTELAALLKVTYPTVQRWEKSKNPLDVRYIPALVKALDLNHPGEIFAELPRETLTGVQRRLAESAAKLKPKYVARLMAHAEELLAINKLPEEKSEPEPDSRKRSAGT